jgi:hypothetical protein
VIRPGASTKICGGADGVRRLYHEPVRVSSQMLVGWVSFKDPWTTTLDGWPGFIQQGSPCPYADENFNVVLCNATTWILVL